MYSSGRYRKASSRIGNRRKIKQTFFLSLKIGLPIALIILFFTIIHMDFMQVKSFEVSGNGSVFNQDIKNIALSSIQGSKFFFIPKSNWLFFDKDSLALLIAQDLPRIKSVEINKGVSGVVDIDASLREASFLWCSYENQCFLMDENGLIFSKAENEELNGKIIFRGNIIDDPISKNFDDIESMKKYIDTINTSKSLNVEISEINLESPERVIFVTNKGKIILNPEEEMSDSIKNAILLIEETLLKNPKTSFEYIDARFGKKLFYKLKP